MYARDYPQVDSSGQRLVRRNIRDLDSRSQVFVIYCGFITIKLLKALSSTLAIH